MVQPKTSGAYLPFLGPFYLEKPPLMSIPHPKAFFYSSNLYTHSFQIAIYSSLTCIKYI